MKKITINRILFIFYFLLFTLLVYTGLLIYQSYSRTIVEYKDIAKIATIKMRVLIELRSNTSNIELTKLNHILITDSSKMTLEEQYINEEFKNNTKLFEEYKTLINDSIEERLFNEIMLARELNTKTRKNVIALSTGNHAEAATDLQYRLAKPAFEKYQHAISLLVSYIENLALNKEKNINKYIESNIQKAFIFLIAIILVLILFGVLIVRSDRALYDSKYFSEFLVDSTPDALVGVDDMGEIILFNSQATAIFGYKKNEIIGKQAAILMPIRFYPAYEKYLIDYYKKTGTRQIGNFRKFKGLRKNGEEFPVNISLNHSFYWGKSIILSNVRDMTIQNNLENSLKESEMRLNEAQKVSQTGSWEIDLKTQKAYWSQEQYRMNGVPYSDAQLFQEDFIKHVHPEDKENLMNNMQEVILKGRHEMEFRILHPDGSIHYMYGIAHVEFDENNKPVKIFGTNQDITERKNVEEELRIQNLELTKTNDELDRFVYSTSHDLRSPLTSVLALVNFIEDETLEEETKLHAKMIHSRIKQLDNFVKNILDYSRNARLIVAHESVNLNEIMQQTVKSLMHAKGAEKIKFTIESKQENPFYSDKQRLSNVFENLIGNAIKYQNSNNTGPFIKITVITNQHAAEITIEDNGIGIAEKQQNNVFEMFYRVSGNVPGSGLGLYLVKEIIEKMNGTINMESKLNFGTKFIIKIPNQTDAIQS